MPRERSVYIASSFGLADRVQRVCDALVSAGHRVPDRWWNENVKTMDLPDDEWYGHPEVVAMAERHWNSIEECDTYVLVCPPSEAKKFNGANIELGYAHANRLDCYSVGAVERSAMYVPLTRLDTVDELVAVLGRGPDARPPLPSDYGSDDGYDPHNGLDQCAHCEVTMSGNGGYMGPVYDSDGNRYETVLDTDPDDRPFFCEGCWGELVSNRRSENNEGLEDYT